MDLGEKVTGNLIAITVVAYISFALIPTALTSIVNLSQISGNPVASLFLSSGVISVLIFIGLFMAFIKLTKFTK